MQYWIVSLGNGSKDEAEGLDTAESGREREWGKKKKKKQKEMRK